MDHLTPLRLSISEVFNVIKEYPWVRRPRPIQYNPSLSGTEEYCSYHDNKGHLIVHCKSLHRNLEELVRQDFLKEYILTLEASFGSRQSSALPSTPPQYAIT